MTSIWRPTGKIVHPRVVGQLHPLVRGNIHQIKVLASGGAGAVVAPPRKSQKLSIRRPRWRYRISGIGDALQVAAISVHNVDLWQASASAHERDLRSRLRIPNRRDVGD